MGHLVMHVDMDAFFASVEQRDDASLRGKPVVVGAQPGSRGVVATCSYEARAFGVRSAMPISEAARLCPTAVFLRPDMNRYQRASQDVMAVLEQISPLVEQVSIDEAYLDIRGLERLFGAPDAIGRLAKARVLEATSLKMSVGIGPNRLIAKLASDFRKPDGLTLVENERVLEFLGPQRVTVLRGVGKALGDALKRANLHRISDLWPFTLPELEQLFGRNAGGLLFHQSRGEASSDIVPGWERKSISSERTFAHDESDTEVLQERLRDMAASVGRQAREEGVVGRVVTLKIRLAGFETHTRQRQLEHPTHDDREVYAVAMALLKESGLARRPVRLLGVGLSAFGDEGEWQPGLFEDVGAQQKERERSEKMLQAMDAINGRYGKRAIGLGNVTRKKLPKP